MWLSQLHLHNFRQFSNRQINFSPDLTLIVGPNASGKSSVMEAINLLATGESFRAAKVEEMILFDQELARVVVEISDTLETEHLEVLLTRGVVQGKKTAKKIYSLNQIKKIKKNVVGKFPIVLFRPEDMRLVEGSPARRRQFIDVALSAVDQSYSWSAKTYEQALKRRNKILEQIRERTASPQTLHYWDQQLVKHGQIVQEKRKTFFQSFQLASFPINFQISYQPSIINQARLEEYQGRSIAAGHTLIGPHKDDFIVNYPEAQHTQALQYLDVAAYGSRGQQRLAVLWLKICELTFIEKKFTIKPILLLDDILSELDPISQAKVITLINNYQTVVTTTDHEIVSLIGRSYPELFIINMDNIQDE